MKITRVETLIEQGEWVDSEHWKRALNQIHDAIRAVDWPQGSGHFIIYPESGKKREQGNGVGPIKIGLRNELIEQGWRFEDVCNLPRVLRPGKLDAVLETDLGLVAVEWETGNISSSHRALNKLALGLLDEVYGAGVLVIPSKRFARYLTDRIGTLSELEPYLPIWKSLPVHKGILQIVEVEHDGTSFDVPRIPKGTDGRAAN